jgi:menaquinone-dependent protoporphyrinogen oxidase
MSVLVVYATRHGSTRGIAERIAQRLGAAGLQVETHPVEEVRDVRPYDAVVLGCALYMFRWLKEGTAFARRNRAALASRPLWLFSSGPTGDDRVNKEGRDVLEVSGPKEIDQLRATLHPRDHRVFFGAWDKSYKPIGFAEKFVNLMPAARDAIPSGDWRDWPLIEAWADEIAAELTGRASASSPSSR